MNNIRNTVLACIDGSTYSEGVVDYAAWVSRTVQNPLKLLHNIDHRHIPVTDLSGNIGLGTRESLMEEYTELEAKASRLLMEQGNNMLDRALARSVQQQAFKPTALQRHGSLADALIDMEDEIRVLVMGVRGEDHENRQNRIGAQLEIVIRSMHRPVLVVNRPFTAPPQRIMLAWDGNDAAQRGVDWIATSPLYHGMCCHIVHVLKDGRTDKAGKPDNGSLQATAARLASAGLEVVTANLHGDVDQALHQYQQEQQIDMTVMGAFGHSRLRELLFGSLTVKILCSAQVPLLLLR